MPKILDGKSTAETIYGDIRKKIDASNIKPCLAVILVGDDPASHVYVKNKEIGCEKAGVESQTIRFDADVSEETVLAEIERLNNDTNVTGMIVQVPLPDHIDEDKVVAAIAPEKDADGFHPNNIGDMFRSKNFETLPPATPAGIVALLERNDIEIAGKNVVVLGRSNNVGKAVAIMMLNRNATITICHSQTQNLAQIAATADILIAAVGRKHFVTADMVKDGAVIVDVGIHRNDDGSLCGDVNFDEVSSKVSAISPVPGGVGPMTVASLIANVARKAGVKI